MKIDINSTGDFTAFQEDSSRCLSTTEIITIGGLKFCVWPEHHAFIKPISDLNVLLPATVIQWDKHSFDEGDYDQICSDFARRDDVWTPNFLHVFVLRARATTVVEFTSPSKYFRFVDPEAVRIPDGPYIIHSSTGKIVSVARLHEDTYSSFIRGGVVLDAVSRRYRWLGTSTIPVPSRLYYSKTESMPLAGLRFAVKDIIDVAGLETGCGSRHYRDLYSSARISAPFIDQLTVAGAILVGKNMCTQFGDGLDPSERFDYCTPFNPRGDGYQLPSSSSSGSAASCAGYPWLDFTVGTDTGGSIRHPAGVNGVYGMRTSLNSVKSRGMTVSALLDTVGVLARSACILDAASRCMVNPTFQFIEPPMRFKLLYPVSPRPDQDTNPTKWFPTPANLSDPTSAESIFENIVQKLEKHLNCKRQPFNINDLWTQTKPQHFSTDQTLRTATNTLYQKIVYHSLAHNTLPTFTTDYAAAHAGRKPYLEPLLAARLAYGRSISATEHATAVTNLHSYAAWINSILFATSSPSEIPLLIYPQSWGIPQYRDSPSPHSAPTPTTPTTPLFGSGFSTFSLSYASGGPDVTVPVGEVAYRSRITGREERLPVALSFVSRVGADLALLGLLRELEEEGVLRSVRAGEEIY